MSSLASTSDVTNVAEHHYRNEGQHLSAASTSIDALSIVDSVNNMEQLPSSSHTLGKLQKKGKLVTFYRNGDPHFKGIAIPISQKWFVTLQTLIDFLNEKISTPTGIRYIFQIPNGEEVKDVESFKPGQSYIVSSVKKLVYDIQYGKSTENFWVNKPPSASKIRKNDYHLYMKNCEEVSQKAESQMSVRDLKKNDNVGNLTVRLNKSVKRPIGREITIVSNTDRKSTYSIIISREHKPRFEDLLYDISDMLNLSNPPIQTLYTASKPFKRVCSYNHLFKEFLKEEHFIACGSEFYPIEMKNAPKKYEMEKPNPIITEPKVYIIKNSSQTSLSKATQTTEELIQPVDSATIRRESVNKSFSNSTNSKTSLSSPQLLTINGIEKVVHSSKLPNSSTKKSSDNQSSLKLNWIYGFHSQISDNCMAVINPNELLYCVGKIAIIYNSACYQQRYFTEHTSAISCFAVHSNRRYVCSGQCAANGPSMVLIWDVNDLTVIIKLSDNLSENIFSLDFSSDGDGEFLMVLDSFHKAQNQNLNIYNWRTNTKVTNTKCNREDVKAGRFHPEDNSTIVTFGYQHINIWRVFWQDKGTAKILRDKKSGIFEFCIPEFVSCAIFDLTGNILSGDSNGSIHLWSLDEEEAFVNRPVPQLYHAHKDSVSCLLLVGDGTVISASNISIKAWDSFNDFKFVKERNIPSNYGNIKSIVSCHPERNDGKLWIATECSTVLEGTLQDSFIVLLQNHGKADSPLQLATSPNYHCFVTGGSDKLLMKWSMLQRKMMWTSPIDNECSALCYHIDGHYVSIGTFNGKLIIVQNKTGIHVMSLQIDLGQKPITCLSYSADGRFLCVGCAKSDLKMFSVLDQGAFCRHIANMEFKNSWNILRIDWSSDSKTIRTEDEEFNTRIWSLQPSVKEKEASEMNKLEFITENCLVTFNNLSLWRSPQVDKLTVVKKAMKSDQIVYGTSAGAIGLAKYPLTNADINPKTIISGSIANIGISFDDSYVLSSSHDIGCSNIFQWTITEG